jgi:Tfp pilus assembly protein PilV
MQTRRRPGPNDQGETLIEVIMAVAIMGIAVVAIVGGIATTILMSDIYRKQATAGAYVRNYAEAVAAPANYQASASPSYDPATVGYVAPPGGGFTATMTSVKCWNGTGFVPCSVANAVQQVTLNVASTDSRASESLVVVVSKP